MNESLVRWVEKTDCGIGGHEVEFTALHQMSTVGAFAVWRTVTRALPVWVGVLSFTNGEIVGVTELTRMAIMLTL